jgi:glycosyltransferase involved in cell wall biosynthesis
MSPEETIAISRNAAAVAQRSLRSPLALATAASRNPERLLIFELSTGGHYPGYIQHLVRYWREAELPGELAVVVTPEFLAEHSDVVATAGDVKLSRVNFTAITPTEAAGLSDRRSGLSRARRAYQEWQLLQQYAQRHRADHCLIPYIDTRQLPLALGAQLPCDFSGIYFRPTFHYPALMNAVPTRREQLQHQRERWLLGRMLANPRLKALFCLDPFVLEPLRSFKTQAQIVPLPDPVQIYPAAEADVERLRQELGIAAERRIFLLFGALDERKGLQQLLSAIALLPPDQVQQLCLLLVGPLLDPIKAPVLAQIDHLRQTLPVQIISVDRFIPDHAIQPYFHLADVVLAPYQRHVGMSAILVRAAAAQTPTLAADYGLMGEITRRYQLGLTVDATDSAAIAPGLTQLLTHPLSTVGDRGAMQAFAAQNSARQFAQTIFNALWSATDPEG